MNSKGETLGTNSLLPFDVNVMLSKQLTTLLDGTYCVRLHTLLHLVACPLGVVTQILKLVKLLATWKPNIVGQQLLGVIGVRPFACSSTNARRMPGKGSGMGTLGLIAFQENNTFFLKSCIIPALLRLCCPKPIPAGKLKTLSRRECWGRTSAGNSIEAGYYERQIWQPLPLFPIHS